MHGCQGMTIAKIGVGTVYEYLQYMTVCGMSQPLLPTASSLFSFKVHWKKILNVQIERTLKTVE